MLAPVTVSAVELPAHMVALEEVSVGIALTVSLAVLVLVHPKEVPEIV